MASVFQREGSKVWIASYRDASGSWRQRKGTGSKQDTLRMARKLERAALERGLQRLQEDPFEQHLEAPIAEHVAAYLSSLRNLGRDETYVLQVDAAIRRVVDAASLKTLQDLDVVRVADAIDGLQKAPRGFAGEDSGEDDEGDEEEGVSRRTKTTIARRLRGFARWLVKAQRVRHDPLAALAFAATRDDEEGRVRRSLTREEVARLLAAAERRPESELRLVRVGEHKGEERAKVREKSLAHARHLGLQRRTIYLLVLWTGLRRGELEKLQWGGPDARLGATGDPAAGERHEVTPRGSTPGPRGTEGRARAVAGGRRQACEGSEGVCLPGHPEHEGFQGRPRAGGDRLRGRRQGRGRLPRPSQDLLDAPGGGPGTAAHPAGRHAACRPAAHGDDLHGRGGPARLRACVGAAAARAGDGGFLTDDDSKVKGTGDARGRRL